MLLRPCFPVTSGAKRVFPRVAVSTRMITFSSYEKPPSPERWIRFFMKLILPVLFFFLSIRLEAQSEPPLSQTKPAPLIYKIITLPDGTFSYDIFTGDHRIIHQTSIPARPGNEGFRRKEDAEKVARLVIDKLNKHIIPPTITVHEMDSLKINY